jgi:hypothetical protein
MPTTLPPDNAPIPATLARERGCSPLWGVIPTGEEPEATRGPLDWLRDRACGSRIACSAWVDAFASSTDQPLIVAGHAVTSHVSNSDLPFNHSSHDWVIDVDTDDAYRRYHSDANPVGPNGRMLLHTEWELNALRDAWAWLPAAGDRVWIAGRWVFDCAHPEKCRTEIHPPQALASWGPGTFVDDVTGAPVEGVQVKAIVSANGGVCFRWEEAAKPLRFAVALPARPSGNAEPILLSESNKSSPSIGPVVEGPEPYVEITLPYAPGDELPWEPYLATIHLGWRSAADTREWRRVRVNLESVRILHTHDLPPDRAGEWNLWARINGTWRQLLRDRKVGQSATIPLEGATAVLDIPMPEDSTRPVLSIETTGWEGDAIDKICRFDGAPEATRRLPDLPGLPDRDDVLKWIVRQAGKVQNERLGHLLAEHRWDDLDAPGRFIRESSHHGRPDFALEYTIEPE